MTTNRSSLIQTLENHGIVTSRQIQEVMGASQATVSRLLRAAGDRVVRIGKGPQTRYFLAHDLFISLPLFRVTATGVPEHIGDLYPVVGGEFFVDSRVGEWWLLGEGKNGVFSGLPYYLDDVRPQGFLGRQIARSLGAPFPADPRRWSAMQILTWFRDHGADLPGNLILGEQALSHLHRSSPLIDSEDYPQHAEEALSGKRPGSSAGGEQPKFLGRTNDGQVLVKFSGIPDNPVAQRWQDILIAEHQALTILRQRGISAALSQLLTISGRTFIELQRFDRAGPKGRSAMISLAAVDAEFVGEGRGWVTSLQQLEIAKMMSKEDVERAMFLQLFGDWIGNSDMHLGNLSLRPEQEQFTLLPIYDMTCMQWAPMAGELPADRTIEPPIRDPRFQELWYDSGKLALEFWRGLEQNDQLSGNFRAIAKESATLVLEYLR